MSQSEFAELGALRGNLLDTTLRNNLLNYRSSPKRTLQITGIKPDELYDLLVLKGRSFRFTSRKRKPEGSDTFLSIPEEPDTLQKKLVYIYNQANSIFEDQGYPVLYIACGFLQWYDVDSQKSPASPILLIPVEMKRTPKTRVFSLSWTGEDIYTSITLQAKMREMNIYIPDFEMLDTIEAFNDFYKNVAESIRDKRGWKILQEIRLDMFNFKKFVMYKDLDASAWPSDIDYPLMKKVFGETTERFTAKGFEAQDVDLRIQAHNSFNVLDADSSQISVIEDAKLCQSLVVEGPPGTGKSQTIVNTIAELIAQGKSVLFISEKMAALQVVKSRMDNVGLGELCLEIHSNKTRKTDVLDSIKRPLHEGHTINSNVAKDIYEIDHVRSDLNNYSSALRNPQGAVFKSLYELFGVREIVNYHFSEKASRMGSYALVEPEKWTTEEYNESRFSLSKLAELAPVIVPITENPWYGTEPDVVLPPQLPAIYDTITKAYDNLGFLLASVSDLCDSVGIKKPETLEDITDATDAALSLPIFKKIPRELLENKEWENESSKEVALKLIEKVEHYTEMNSSVLKVFKPEIFDINTTKFPELSQKTFKSINGEYKKLKNNILKCYISEKPNDMTIRANLVFVEKTKQAKQDVENLDNIGKKYFCNVWKGVDSDIHVLYNYVEKIRAFNLFVRDGIFTSEIFNTLKNFNESDSKAQINDVINKHKIFNESISDVISLLHIDPVKAFFNSSNEIETEKLLSILGKWRNNTNSLVFWSQYIQFRKICLKTRADFLINDFENGKIDPADLVQTFEGNYIDTMITRAFKVCPILSSFIREVHEGKIERFNELDKSLLISNRVRVTEIARNEMNKALANPENAPKVKILLDEFNKKRRHMPIRKLMCKAGSLIQKIKPCFMMSPLSVAQYLDPRSTKFDVIVFDEASQIKPEDAIGALMRGNQVVVMGDSKQLPPTDFFDAVVTSDVDFEEDASGDMESILSVCKRSFPVKTLRWHYRSRHESLIAISNQEFYDNQLYVYPSPMQKDENLGLKFVHLPDAVYDRGKTGANREEARAVAQAVYDHFAKNPEKSLGVGTFNIKQQEAIRDEIENLADQYKDVDINAHREHFFVKNLETIQGDERDVILLSIGFGFDAEKTMTLNFGALNQDGGERRLNVLITRAREKCVIYSNFRAQDLDTEKTNSVGVRALKSFLEFAESGSLARISEKTVEESAFEDTVYSFLTQNGVEIHRNVGCSGYKMDFAVPDPENPGKYVLGIECDGAKYHNARVCRDRDRLRKQILKGLGWQIFSVWSADWYLHPEESQKILLEAVRKAVGMPVMQDDIQTEPILA